MEITTQKNNNKVEVKNLFILLFFIIYSCSKQEQVKLNNIQVIGSHNSYKKAIEPYLWNHLYQLDSLLLKSLQYEHITLEKQLNLGLRNLELDVFHDPLGGRYKNPKGIEIVKQLGYTPASFDLQNELSIPGLKMFHVQDIDFRSHYLLFKNGLRALKNWSDNNPEHTPIFILINTKDNAIENLTKPIEFTASALDSLDMEIKSILPQEKLITPDLIRGHSETMEQAITTIGWPDLETMKGRFLFVLDENEDKIKAYLSKYPNLKGAALFVNSIEGNPEAGFRIINDPVKDFNYIQKLVSKGYIVRTRADAGTVEARKNDYTKFKKAKASGAQIISTDYYLKSLLFNSNYEVIFDDGTYERIKSN